MQQVGLRPARRAAGIKAMNMDAEIFKRQLHILHLEDDEPDHLLMSAMLATGGLLCEIRLAKSKDEFAAALTGPPFDLIISDYSLPSYDGLSALKLARQAAPATPFVFFSGTIGEEVAVESLKHGAADYVLKRPGAWSPPSAGPWWTRPSVSGSKPSSKPCGKARSACTSSPRRPTM